MSVIIVWVVLSVAYSVVLWLMCRRAVTLEKAVNADKDASRLEIKMARSNVWLYRGLFVVGLSHLAAGILAVVRRMMLDPPTYFSMFTVSTLILAETLLLITAIKRWHDTDPRRAP